MRLIPRRAMLIGCGSLSVALRPGKLRAAEPDAVGELQLRDPPKPLPPTLRWTNEQGAPETLKTYAGQGVVLNFWATWCAPCVAEMPALATLAARLSQSGIAVIPVAADAAGAPPVRQFYATHHITLPIYLDPHSAALDSAAAVGLPTTLIINRAGLETARIAGAADWSTDQALQTIKALCT